jgi:hypothetical protein
VNGWQPGRNLLDQAAQTAATILAIVLMLRFAWIMLQPLIPVLLVGFALAGGVAAVIAYRRSRW